MFWCPTSLLPIVPSGRPTSKPLVWISTLRILGHQPVGDRMLGEIDGVGVVPLRVRILSPAVADDEHERTLGDFTADGMVPFDEGQTHHLMDESPCRKGERRSS